MLMSVLASVLVPVEQPRPVLAYLDPGTGSLLLQATLAALLSVPFILRSRLQAIVARLRHGGNDETPSSREPSGRRP